jgi:hypothetical protein
VLVDAKRVLQQYPLNSEHSPRIGQNLQITFRRDAGDLDWIKYGRV